MINKDEHEPRTNIPEIAVTHSADHSCIPTDLFMICYHITFSDGQTINEHYRTTFNSEAEAQEVIPHYRRTWEHANQNTSEPQITLLEFHIHKFARTPF